MNTSLNRRLDRLEAVAPVNSWDEWGFEQLERYSKLLIKELTALDGGEPLTVEEERDRQAFSARAPQNHAIDGLSLEQLKARQAALDEELRQLCGDPFSFL